ncbi:MAG: hypothetical protein BAJALOKI1v1_580006 [Promethearchaeota archaeon]|nr:MAG: hypothetical protein BAJALOKI1v1_580006 [Candidatus Lokiarchaeota archaeon]
MGVRTKKLAHVIESFLPKIEFVYHPFEVFGKLGQKMKTLEAFSNGDFSRVQESLENLDISPYKTILMGMPTYGNFPPKLFDEILVRMDNIQEKSFVLFSTSLITGEGTIEYMNSELEARKGNVLARVNLQRFFKIGKEPILEFLETIAIS